MILTQTKELHNRIKVKKYKTDNYEPGKILRIIFINNFFDNDNLKVLSNVFTKYSVSATILQCILYSLG